MYTVSLSEPVRPESGSTIWCWWQIDRSIFGWSYSLLALNNECKMKAKKISMEIGVHRLKRKISSFRTGFLLAKIGWQTLRKCHNRVDKKTPISLGKKFFCPQPSAFQRSSLSHFAILFGVLHKKSKSPIGFSFDGDACPERIGDAIKVNKSGTNLADWMAALEPPPLFCLSPWFI